MEYQPEVGRLSAFKNLLEKPVLLFDVRNASNMQTNAKFATLMIRIWREL